MLLACHLEILGFSSQPKFDAIPMEMKFSFDEEFDKFLDRYVANFAENGFFSRQQLLRFSKFARVKLKFN